MLSVGSCGWLTCGLYINLLRYSEQKAFKMVCVRTVHVLQLSSTVSYKLHSRLNVYVKPIYSVCFHYGALTGGQQPPIVFDQDGHYVFISACNVIHNNKVHTLLITMSSTFCIVIPYKLCQFVLLII